MNNKNKSSNNPNSDRKNSRVGNKSTPSTRPGTDTLKSAGAGRKNNPEQKSPTGRR